MKSADRYGWTEQSQNFLSIAEAEKASIFFIFFEKKRLTKLDLSVILKPSREIPKEDTTYDYV